MPMRDGIRLRADVYRPSAPGRYPTLLTRTPYSKDLDPRLHFNVLNPVSAAFAGYVVVIQDVRGRFESDGEFVIFEQEQTDGYDTVEWCAGQSWSNGRVGMYGLSYAGVTQLQAAFAGPPSLRAIAPGLTDSNYYHGWTYEGGAFQLGFNLSWVVQLHAMDVGRLANAHQAVALAARLPDLLQVLPIGSIAEFSTIPSGRAYLEWLAHPTDDAFWQRLSLESRYHAIGIPSLNISGWYDLFTRGGMRAFVGMRTHGATQQARLRTRLVVGPWDHQAPLSARIGDRQMSNRGQFFGHPVHVRWFDQWLKDIDTGLQDDPPVQVFVVGPDQWRTYPDWPPPETRFEPVFLHSGGHANGLGGDGELVFVSPRSSSPPDQFIYDPLNPVPSRGGIWNIFDGLSGGAFDQRAIETRDDVLVYTSAPLTQPLEIVGPVTARVWAASDAPDTDFTAKLVDVTPEGPAWNVCDGIIRARYRTSFTEPAPIAPGEPLEYTIDMRATAYRFGAGHQLRLEITSSNFPRFDRNPNTGTAVAGEQTTRSARQSVHHDANFPSQVILPVQPRPQPPALRRLRARLG